jgi:multidrug efflux pump subunit AcrA (membrane-fusion protein)
LTAHATRLLSALLLPALLAATACNRSQAETGKAPAAPSTAPAPTFRPIPVNITPAQSRPVQRTVETSGSVLAGDEVQAKSEQPGTIARLRVDLGDRVTAERCWPTTIVASSSSPSTRPRPT